MRKNDGLVAATAALPRWAALTGRNAELLAYLKELRRFGDSAPLYTSRRSPSSSPRIFTNPKEK
jgi:hypothetical protein